MKSFFRILLVILGIVITSLYIFPIEFTFFPPKVNSKMIMAVFGAIMFFINKAKTQKMNLNSDLLGIFIIAIIVSLVGLFSINYNNTSDYTYATYIITMIVWLAAAYVPVIYIKWVHNKISLELICIYLILVCVAQCISAVLIDTIPWFKTIVQTYVRGVGFVATLSSIDGSRLYGIGAMLDVAGQKFGCMLIMIVYICTHDNPSNHIRKYTIFYVIAFFIILIIGNMIGRTTTVGAAIAIFYASITYFKKQNSNKNNFLWSTLITIITVLPYIIYKYNTDVHFNENIRFGFEGFFSLIEKGKWETNSNNILQNMIRWPDNFKTWIIGNGYFSNPSETDPYYIGYQWKGFYMGTDIGYLRFIFYFGIIGLIAFSIYFLKVYLYLCKKLPKGKELFLLILIINFIVWLKVSSDIFMVLAPFLLLPSEHEETLISDKQHVRE